MQFYHVKAGASLNGVPDDCVERFSDQKAGVLLIEGRIERYDEKQHGKKSGAPAPKTAAPIVTK